MKMTIKDDFLFPNTSWIFLYPFHPKYRVIANTAASERRSKPPAMSTIQILWSSVGGFHHHFSLFTTVFILKVLISSQVDNWTHSVDPIFMSVKPVTMLSTSRIYVWDLRLNHHVLKKMGYELTILFVTYATVIGPNLTLMVYLPPETAYVLPNSRAKESVE